MAIFCITILIFLATSIPSSEGVRIGSKSKSLSNPSDTSDIEEIGPNYAYNKAFESGAMPMVRLGSYGQKRGYKAMKVQMLMIVLHHYFFKYK